MEEITIKSIDKKDSGLVIIGYNENKEATMNTGWQSQEVDYFEKDVGIGGTVKCLIIQKGNYTNITKVDFDSAKKGINTIPIKEYDEGTAKVGLMSQKDIMIVSQCLTKAWVRTDKKPQEILDAYRFFVLELEQNG